MQEICKYYPTLYKWLEQILVSKGQGRKGARTNPLVLRGAVLWVLHSKEALAQSHDTLCLNLSYQYSKQR